MSDSNEIMALKASVRGALATGDTLSTLASSIDALDPRDEVSAAGLEEIARVTLAHAVAAQALRGLVNSMLTRRGVTAA